jgi:hypothetical protein
MPNKSGSRLRGYGAAHVRLRKIWDIRVQRGGVNCARCGRLIEPGTPWDLGHDDHDRTIYSGAEHRKCNRGAPSIARGAARNTVIRHSRVW